MKKILCLLVLFASGSVYGNKDTFLSDRVYCEGVYQGYVISYNQKYDRTPRVLPQCFTRNRTEETLDGAQKEGFEYGTSYFAKHHLNP